MHDDILQQQFFESLAQSRLNEEQVKTAKTLVTSLSDIMANFRKDKLQIMNNGRLSDSGKQTDLANLQNRTHDHLVQFMDTDIEKLNHRIGELTYQLRPQEPSKDITLDFLRQQEVRQLLGDKDELVLMGMYQELAISGKNDLIMRAIEEAPIPLISDQSILEAGKQARTEREDPESAELLHQLKHLSATIESAFNSYSAELNIIADPLIEAARGGK